MIAQLRDWIGRHPRATGGAIVLSAVLLLLVAGGLVIATLSAPLSVGQPVESRSPTPTPATSVGPSAAPVTPRPTETMEPTGTPAPTPEPVTAAVLPTVDHPFAAIVLVNELRVRESPGDGIPVGSLQAGQIIEIHGEPQAVDGVDWYPSQASEDTYGWVSAGPETDPYLELHRPLARQLPASVEDVVGSSAGYLAWGTNARRSDEVATRFVTVSANGVDWQRAELPIGPDVAQYLHGAHGPAGWVLVATNGDLTGPGGVWRSDDGLAWHEVDASIPAGVVPEDLLGTAAGYVLSVRDDRPANSRAMVFTSADGMTWRQLDPDLAFGLRLARLADGFVAFGQGESDDLYVRTSIDGQTWATGPDLSLQGGGTTPMVEVIDGDLLVMASVSDITRSELRVWRSSPTGPFAWNRQPDLEALFTAQSIAIVESDGDSMIFGGQRFSDGADAWWRSDDGLQWEAIDPVGASLVDLQPLLVAGPNGFVGVTHELTPAGPNPRFIGTHTGVDWGVSATSVLGTVDSAVVGACPQPPETMLEWLAVPGAIGAECFGSSPITFTAWHADAGGCGGFAPGRYEPVWLASPFALGRLILTPMEIQWGGCGSAVVAPEAPDLPATQQWVEVTGHWNDQAAADCHYIPDPSYPGAGEAHLAFRCRTSFVATTVTPTTAP